MQKTAQGGFSQGLLVEVGGIDPPLFFIVAIRHQSKLQRTLTTIRYHHVYPIPATGGIGQRSQSR